MKTPIFLMLSASVTLFSSTNARVSLEPLSTDRVETYKPLTKNKVIKTAQNQQAITYWGKLHSSAPKKRSFVTRLSTHCKHLSYQHDLEQIGYIIDFLGDIGAHYEGIDLLRHHNL